jgi:4'-phosphopantetheinyl transferase
LLLDAATLAFDLSSSGSVALCAVASGGEVGVDVEAIRPELDLQALTRRVLSRHERGQLALLPPGRQAGAFTTAWVRKEAVVKAWGIGFSFPLDLIEVGIELEPAVPLPTREPPGRRWELLDLPIGPDHAAAVAATRFDGGLTCWRWAPGRPARRSRAAVALVNAR